MAPPTPRIHVETIRRPQDYPEPQPVIACAIYAWLNRGTPVLTEPPWEQ